MNKRRLKVISDWLRAGAPHKKGIDGFDMEISFGKSYENPDCGTVACIGGAAICFFERKFDPTKEVDAYCLDSRAGHLLELDHDRASQLFFPNQWGGPELEEITTEWAANCIDHLIETGEVDWWATKPKA